MDFTSSSRVSRLERIPTVGVGRGRGFLWFAPNPEKNKKAYIMDDYGSFTMDVIRVHEESYVGTESRKAQDNRMMYECMYHSLSVEG